MANFEKFDAAVVAWKKDVEDEEVKAKAHIAAEGKLTEVTANANTAIKDATSELSAAKDAEDLADALVATDKRAVATEMDAVSSGDVQPV